MAALRAREGPSVIFDGGIRVPSYVASIPRSNTTPAFVVPDFFNAFVLPDFFGTQGRAVRALHQAELERARFESRRTPGRVFVRNCSELLAPELPRAVRSIWQTPLVLEALRARTNTSLRLFPPTDEKSVHALRYSEPGDGISPHFDGNPFQGRRLAVIYVVRDDAESLLHFEGEPVQAPEGSVVVFEGDRLRHSVPPRQSQGVRLVVNALFCEPPCEHCSCQHRERGLRHHSSSTARSGRAVHARLQHVGRSSAIGGAAAVSWPATRRERD